MNVDVTYLFRSGVYFLYGKAIDDSELLMYIGQAKWNAGRRIGLQIDIFRRKHSEKITRIEFLPCPEQYINWVEGALIRSMKPCYCVAAPIGRNDAVVMIAVGNFLKTGEWKW